MEKKIDKKFYYLSMVNIVPAILFGGGLTINSAILIASLVVLVINHTILVNLVRSVTMAASGSDSGSQRHLFRILSLMLLKFCLLFGMVGLFYFYKRELITKLFLLIVFQLIIQVLSIKNNYQNS